MQKVKVVIIFLIVCFFSISNKTEAWDDKRTHTDLSEMATRKSVLGVQDYLKNIGFPKGLDEKINGKEVFKWIRDGAELEDNYTTWDLLNNHGRFNNHFHNPVKQFPWFGAGLNDTFLGITYTGTSSLLWAQDGDYQVTFIEGDWSWQTIRNYYYFALTLTTDAERQKYFARTFRGLGHQMHLIQDAAQPDHVRNDIHVQDSIFKRNIFGSYYFEEWAKENYLNINALASNPIFPEVPLNISYNNIAPITQFIDTDQYTGGNPSVSLTQGIAEYTNANFYSDDTIFAAERYSTDHRHYFPYPKRSSTDLDAYIAGAKAPETVTDKDGNTYADIWISKTGDGEAVSHLVRPSYLSSSVYARAGEGNLFYQTFYRDEICHEDYAKKLIPRAVGYSAGLINYFFRGQIDILHVQGGIKVRNTNQETMTFYTDTVTSTAIGQITIYYDDTLGNRHPLATYDITIDNLSTPQDERILAPGQETPVIPFTEPSDNIKPYRYIIIFHGKLGNEEGAVIGKVTTPLHIYYVSKRGGIDKIYRIESDGSNQTIIYDNQQPDTQIQIGKLAVSSDGTKLAYTIATPNPPYYNISLLDLTIPVSGSNPTFLTQGNWPSFSPDGTKIAFERDLGGAIEIFTIGLTTGAEPIQLTSSSGVSANGRPVWSPDGGMIAYSKSVSGDSECFSEFYPVIYLMDTSGNPIDYATCSIKEADSARKGAYPWNPYGIDGAPAWSSDSQEITFARKRIDGYDQDTGIYMEFKDEVFKVSASTKAITKLTNSTGLTHSELTPSWSPDGKSIAIGSNIDGDFDIWLIDPNGNYIANLTNSNLEMDGYPVFVWLP